jgi:alpha-beta hydrolase superfamily lysophospholipase
MVELSEATFDIDYDGEDFTVKLSTGPELLGQTWRPEGDPKFIYIFMHGLGAFVTFKKDFFRIILREQGVVFGSDHLGHGRSPGARVSCTPDELADEVVQVARLARERYPSLPILLHGHSMGGLAVIWSILTRCDDLRPLGLKAVIAEAPWLSKCPQRPTLKWYEKFGFAVLKRVWPTVKLTAGVPLFSDDLDPTWVALCKATPLYCYNITPRLYTSGMDAQDYVQGNPGAWPRDIPLLFLQGGKDPLVDAVDNGKWIEKVIARNEVDVTYKYYPDSSHVLLKCVNRGEVVRDILNFLHSHFEIN